MHILMMAANCDCSGPKLRLLVGIAPALLLAVAQTRLWIFGQPQQPAPDQLPVFLRHLEAMPSLSANVIAAPGC